MAPAPEDYVSDREIARRWRVSIKTARRAISQLPGFPPRDALFGGKRYWPAIGDFMKDRAKGNVQRQEQPKLVENWDAA